MILTIMMLTRVDFLQEEGEAIELFIRRDGGSLVPRFVRYSILPLGGEEFYGATNEMRFEIGETNKTANVLARGDGIPEV